MLLITRQTQANTAAKQWRAQYPLELPPCVFDNGETSVDVYEALVALGPSPDPDAVDVIVENTSWTAVGLCTECGASPPQLVQFGADENDKDTGFLVCGDCLIKALNLHEENC